MLIAGAVLGMLITALVAGLALVGKDAALAEALGVVRALHESAAPPATPDQIRAKRAAERLLAKHDALNSDPWT